MDITTKFELGDTVFLSDPDNKTRMVEVTIASISVLVRSIGWFEITYESKENLGIKLYEKNLFSSSQKWEQNMILEIKENNKNKQ